MNDFFNVLDDFELEEFAPAGEPASESTFSLDVEGDASGEAALEDINNFNQLDKLTKKDVTSDGHAYVWDENGSPFSGNGSGIVLGLYNITYVENDNGISVGIIEGLKDITGVTFTEEIADGNPFIIKDTDVALAATAGTVIDLSEGNVTGGYFTRGTAHVRIQDNYSEHIADIYNSTEEYVELDLVGFLTPDSADDLTFTANNANLLTVNTTEDEGGQILVDGDYNVDIDEDTVKVRNATGTYKVTYDADGNTVLDLSSLSAKSGQVITVVEADDVDQIIPSTSASQIRIIDETTTYEYATSGKAYFKLADGDVEGFVFVSEDDSITLNNPSSTFKFFDADEEELPLAVSGNPTDYTVKYDSTDGEYTVIVDSTATVTIDGKTFDFTIKSGAEVAIKFTEKDGKIESVDGLYNLADGDQVVVEGITATNATSGLPVYNNSTSSAVKQYISTDGDKFTLIGGTSQQLEVEDGDKVFAVYDPVGELAVDGTVTDENGLEFASDGSGYFIYNDGITGFVFMKKGDTVTLPDGDGEDIDLYYLDTTTPFEVPLTNSKGFQVTLSDTTDKDDPQFTISKVTEGAIIPSTTDPLAEDLVAVDEDNEFIMNLKGQILAINNAADDGEIALEAGEYTITIDGNKLYYNTSGDIIVNGDTVTGLDDGDKVSIDNADTEFVFATDGNDVFTVNDVDITVTGDYNDITITAGGVISGLDEGAQLLVSEGPVTVNGVPYTAEDIANNDEIVGFAAKDTTKGIISYIEDPAHPLFNENTSTASLIESTKWLNLDTTDYDAIYESQLDDDELVSELDRSDDTGRSLIYLDDDNDVTAKFNNLGKNVAVVTADAEGAKNIILGDHGDAVIMKGTSENDGDYASIIGGEGNDTIFVGGTTANDKVVLDANMKTYIDLSSGGVDKVHTYAAANANIILENYDETSLAGVVIHDPEVPYIKDLVDAIQDELLVFEDGGVTAIDRDEEYNGNDRKTRITVQNKDSNHQTMIRLFGYRDNKDTYSDDYGQLVGWTGKDGGTLDASDIDEDLILIGNMNDDKLAGSSLKTGAGNDTIFAGGKDTVDTGDGVDVIIFDKEAIATRESATIIVGRGAGDSIQNLQDGFDGDVFDVTAFDGKLDYAFADGDLTIVDKSSKSTLTATTTVTADFIEQRFVNGSDTLYAAIAKEEGTIKVTDADDTVPNYYLAKDGAIDFSEFSGEVHMDVDGEDYDWSGPNMVGSTENVTLGSGVNTLYGGSGTTIFKGGKADETLVAGTGESSLYGAGGKNLLVGQYGNEDKFGSTEFFNIGIHNGAQNTITGFEFIADRGTNQATFDNLNLGLSDNNEVTDIKANDDGSVSVAIKGAESGAIETVVLEGAAGKEFLVDRGTETETVAQIAATEVTVNNSYVDFYCATDDANGATVKVGDIDATEIWLDAPDYGNGVDFSNSKFTVVDASESAAQVLIAGNDLANTIIGGDGNASMWGGSGVVNDVMYGGKGHNEFYFEGANGNDTIMSANNGDVIQLGVTLDQIDFDNTNVTSTGVEIKLTDGSSLTLNSTAEVNIVLDDGTTAKVNRATQSFE